MQTRVGRDVVLPSIKPYMYWQIYSIIIQTWTDGGVRDR